MIVVTECPCVAIRPLAVADARPAGHRASRTESAVEGRVCVADRRDDDSDGDGDDVSG